MVITGGGTGLTYQPDPNYCNDPPGTTTDDFTYTLTVARPPPSSVTVTCVDDPPTAVNDSATVLEDAAATAVDVLANDTDTDGGPKSDRLGHPAGQRDRGDHRRRHRTDLPAQPELLQRPAGTTPDTFTYTLNGGSTATVSVTVTCVNDAPVADDETFNGANSAVGNTALRRRRPDRRPAEPGHAEEERSPATSWPATPTSTAPARSP